MKSGLKLAIALKGVRGLISRRKVSRIVQLEGCYGVMHYSTILLIRYIWDEGTAGLPKTTDYWEK
jgi:hypothetical protein